MASGCVERYEQEFAEFIWNFRKDNRAKYYRLLNEVENVDTILLKNRRMVKNFLCSL